MQDVVRLLAYALKRSASDTRTLIDELEAAGVYMTYRPTTSELCPCGYHFATESGLCAKCEAEEEAFAAIEGIESERQQLAEYRTKLENVLKQQRKRMRSKFLANPRDSENRLRWEIAKELLEDIAAAQDEEFGEEDDALPQ